MSENMNNLSKLKQVDLREAWAHEAHDFTNWLAEDVNLSVLGDSIGLELSLIQTEANVGTFSVDILAEEVSTAHKIIIENQLEVTNHDHLGKIITYASGYDARVVIWVVKDAREEHRQAIDWLNEHTDDELEFFLIRIELWQIDNSPLAPKFEIISRPNDWAKAVKESAGSSKLTETKVKQLEFWDSLKAYAKEQGSALKLRKSRPQHWTDISIGNRDLHISLTLNTKENQLGTEIYIVDNKELFNQLYEKKDEIERELGEVGVLEWMELPEKKASRIKISKPGNIDNEQEWEQYFAWLLEKAERFQEVFPKYWS